MSLTLLLVVAAAAHPFQVASRDERVIAAIQQAKLPATITPADEHDACTTPACRLEISRAAASPVAWVSVESDGRWMLSRIIWVDASSGAERKHTNCSNIEAGDTVIYESVATDLGALAQGKRPSISGDCKEYEKAAASQDTSGCSVALLRDVAEVRLLKEPEVTSRLTFLAECVNGHHWKKEAEASRGAAQLGELQRLQSEQQEAGRKRNALPTR